MTYALYKIGSFTNYGVVTGAQGIYFSGPGATLINRGSITGTAGNAVRMSTGGRLFNGGYIKGSFEGVRADAAVYITNTGTITGTDWGVVMSAGGTIESGGDGFTSNGRIYGGVDGVLSFGFADVGNGYGSIDGNRFGINLENGGTVNNDIGGIFGGQTAIYIAGGLGTVVNNGNIIGGESTSADGINLNASGYVTNQSHGYIKGGSGSGVYSYARTRSATVTNYGTISSGGAGVYLRGNAGANIDGGYVSNKSGALIYGTVGVSISVDGYVSNAGSITGTVTGIDLSGDVENLSSGVITGYKYGVLQRVAFDRLTNSGLITAQYTAVQCDGLGDVLNLGTGVIAGNTGVVLASGGYVFNGHVGTHLGTISGHFYDGVRVDGAYAKIHNQGLIKGAYGVVLYAGGNIINESGAIITGYGARQSSGVGLYGSASATITNSGTISGSYYGVKFTGSGGGTLTNSGVIKGGTDGVSLAAAGTITNSAHGTITGASAGIVVSGSGVIVTDGGTLSGGTYAAKFSGSNDTLALAPGAVLVGAVRDTGSGGALLLQKGTVAGTLAGLGSSVTGFTAVTEQAGATWRLSGNATVASGSKLTVHGSLAVTGALSGGGTVAIGPQGVLSVGGTVAAGGSLVFLAGGHEAASFAQPVSFGDVISGFTLASDVIDLRNFVATGKTVSGHILTLNRSGGSAAHLHFAGSYTSSQFHIGSDSHGGTLLTFV